MLIFADAEKFVRVLRADGERRARVGVILKNTYELKRDENTSLSEAEVAEIQSVISNYQEVEKAQRSLDMRRFPQILRQATDYYEGAATEFEKRLISMAIAEAQKVIRRVDLKNSPSRGGENTQSLPDPDTETAARERISKTSRGRR